MILRLCLFAVAFMGVCCQCNRLFRQPAAFVPILTCCTLSCVLLIAGILNVLRVIPPLFIAAGLYGCGYELLRGGRFRWLRNPAVWTLLAASVYFFIYFYGHYISAGDDFNNWAIVVRVMLRYNRLPRFTDTIILFPSYPTGTAGFIYLVCRVLGSDSGGTLLFAQMFLLLCALIPPFALVRRNQYLSFGVIAICSVMLLTVNDASHIRTLHVDALLAIVCFSGMVIGCCHRDDMEKSWPVLLPIACFLAVTKGSGLYFSLLLAVLAACCVWRSADKRAKWRCLAGLVLLPLCLLLLWNRHADLVFEGGLMTRHSTALRYMLNQALGKHGEDYTAILRGFLATFTDFATMRSAVATLVLLIGLALAGKLSAARPRFSPASLLLASVAIYASYMLGLLGMYLFNLPENTIESFVRYENTALLLILGLAAIYLIELANALPDAPKRARILPLAASAAVLAAFPLIAKPPLITLVQYPEKDEVGPKTLAALMPARDKETRYLVYVWDGHREQTYGHRLVHYTAYPAQSDIVGTADDGLAMLDDWPEHYDYFIAFWTDDAYTAYAEAHGLDPTVKLWTREAYLAAYRDAAEPLGR